MKTLKQLLYEIDEYYVHLDETAINAIIAKIKEWLQQKLEEQKNRMFPEITVINELLEELEKR